MTNKVKVSNDLRINECLFEFVEGFNSECIEVLINQVHFLFIEKDSIQFFKGALASAIAEYGF